MPANGQKDALSRAFSQVSRDSATCASDETEVGRLSHQPHPALLSHSTTTLWHSSASDTGSRFQGLGGAAESHRRLCLRERPEGYKAWYRYVTLAMLALAFLAVTRASLVDGNDQLVTSANEIRRMFTALCGSPRHEQHARRWSRWRHRHQERARGCHCQRQRQRQRQRQHDHYRK